MFLTNAEHPVNTPQNHPPDAMENLDIDGLDEFDDEVRKRQSETTSGRKKNTYYYYYSYYRLTETY